MQGRLVPPKSGEHQRGTTRGGPPAASQRPGVGGGPPVAGCQAQLVAGGANFRGGPGTLRAPLGAEALAVRGGTSVLRWSMCLPCPHSALPILI